MLHKGALRKRVETQIAELDVAIHDGLENVKHMEGERERLKQLLQEPTTRVPRPSRRGNQSGSAEEQKPPGGA